MFDLSFGELCMIGGVGLIVLGPKQLTVAVRYVRNMLRQVKEATSSIQHQVNTLLDEDETRSITGDDGKEYECFTLPDMHTSDTQPTPRHRDGL